MVQFQRRPPRLRLPRLGPPGQAVSIVFATPRRRCPPCVHAPGEQWTKARQLEAAERTIDLERVINDRVGLARKDDRLPERLTEETLEAVPGHSTAIHLDVVSDSYFGAMG